MRPLRRPPGFLSRFWLLPVALALCAAVARWNALRDQVRGNGYTDATANWSKGMRPPSPGSNQVFGVDERARQIESNLGYR